MPQWFKTKFAYTEPLDDSNVGTKNQEFTKSKVVNVALLIDAISYGDAETKTVETASKDGHHDIFISQDVRFPLADVFRYDDGDEWYLGKVDFIIEDEKTGKQKRNKSRMLVNASSNIEASQRLQEKLKSSLDPFEITHVDKTDIVEVIEYEYK